MKKQHIILLGVIFGLALISLIVLQINYFQRTLEVRREQFVLTVYKSMDEVIDYIREKEKDFREAEGNRLHVKEDGNIGLSFSRGASSGSFALGESSFSLGKEELQEERLGNKTKEDNLKRSILKLQEEIRARLGTEYSLVFEKENPDGVLKKILHEQELRRVIESTLENHHISGNVEFAIKEQGEFILTSAGFNRHIQEYAFTKKIFPRLEERAPVLYLKLPERPKDSRVILWMLLPSILIIIALVGCFVFCFVVIIRQKRLSVIKNDFINNMTHEFKTPLATISLAAQMLKEGAVATPEGLNQVATIIVDESKRLTFQIERVLQTALFTESRIKLKLKKISINDIISDLFPKLSLRVTDKKGVLCNKLEALCDEVWGDEVHITNVMSNLVDNAIKYTINPPEIEIKTFNQDDNIVIQVKDNGIGIAKKDQKLVFERFYRVSTGNLHDVKGFGLGLSYVKKIIEAHGGAITAESVLGEGSIFNIIIPLMVKKEK